MNTHRFTEPRCGPMFDPENGTTECWFCGRFLHEGCEAWHEPEFDAWLDARCEFNPLILEDA